MCATFEIYCIVRFGDILTGTESFDMDL